MAAHARYERTLEVSSVRQAEDLLPTECLRCVGSRRKTKGIRT
jgi:hypothetical protein